MKSHTINSNHKVIPPNTRNHDNDPVHQGPFALVCLAAILAVLSLSGCTGHTSAVTGVTTTTTVVPPAGLVVATTSLPAGQVQATYTAQLSATGGTAPYSWSVSSANLPAGLTLSSTGAISGTPTQSENFPFTLSVKDSSSSPQTASQAFSIIIAATPTLQITTSSLPAGQVQSPYTSRLAESGNTEPSSWSVVGGLLPPGLTLNASTGNIAGAPTKAGAFSVTMQVRDSATPVQTATKAFSLAISASPLQITTSSVPGGAVGVSYSATLVASNGVPPYAWSVQSGQFPPGLSLQGSTGQISGTPSQTGAFSFSVQARDSAGQTASSNFNASIAPASAPIVSSMSPKSGPTSGGTPVTVSGVNFKTGDTVLFGGVAASGVTVSSATEIQAVTPAHIAGPITVTVQDAGGQSANLANGFTYDTTVTSITVTPNNQTTSIGGEVQYKAVDNFGNNITSSVVWNSSDSSIASITSLGLATGRADGGPITITATK
jgi:IPT/TIG domain/Putative Ig domain